MVKGKTTNGLMRHLRDKHGIEINGSKHKKDLLNIGYYHGYKGYRFIGKANNQIHFSNFDELVAVYKFDANLKELLYPRIMFIETAIKNHTLNTLIKSGPADFDFAFSNLLNDYKKESPGDDICRIRSINKSVIIIPIKMLLFLISFIKINPFHFGLYLRLLVSENSASFCNA